MQKSKPPTYTLRIVALVSHNIALIASMYFFYYLIYWLDKPIRGGVGYGILVHFGTGIICLIPLVYWLIAHRLKWLIIALIYLAYLYLHLESIPSYPYKSTFLMLTQTLVMACGIAFGQSKFFKQ